MRVVSALAGKGLNAGRGGNGLLGGLQRVLHKILQPEAVQDDDVGPANLLHLRDGQRIIMQAGDAFRDDPAAAEACPLQQRPGHGPDRPGRGQHVPPLRLPRRAAGEHPTNHQQRQHPGKNSFFHHI